MFGVVNSKFIQNSGWTLIERDSSLVDEGDMISMETRHTGVRVDYIPCTNSQIKTQDGNYQDYDAEMIVNKYSITGLGIYMMPQHIYMEHPYYGRFRVIKIDDYSRNPLDATYYLYLQGDEHAYKRLV